jgi:hypothetical protein
MGATLTILVGLGLYTLFCYYKSRINEQDDSIDYSEEEQREIVPTRTLVMRILRSIGSEPLAEENTGRIFFSYQGEQFFIACSNDSPFITIYDVWWYQISMDADIEEFACMKKAVNSINAYANCTALYSTNEEERVFGLHLKKNIPFIVHIPNIEVYLRSTLEDFFTAQRAIITEMERNKVKEEQI